MYLVFASKWLWQSQANFKNVRVPSSYTPVYTVHSLKAIYSCIRQLLRLSS